MSISKGTKTTENKKKVGSIHEALWSVTIIFSSEFQVPSTSSITVQQIHAHDRFPATFFIAPGVFQATHLELPPPNITIPQYILDVVGDLGNVRQIAELYFAQVHNWFPIALKWQFYRRLLNPLSQRKLELYLLVASMKLATSCANNFDLKLYKIVKLFYYELEVEGFMSISILQAGIISTLWELGHAIYPAAYLSIGSCARHGVVLGIDRDLKCSPSESSLFSVDALEERRRMWWSILILDRFVHREQDAR